MIRGFHPRLSVGGPCRGRARALACCLSAPKGQRVNSRGRKPTEPASRPQAPKGQLVNSRGRKPTEPAPRPQAPKGRRRVPGLPRDSVLASDGVIAKMTNKADEQTLHLPPIILKWHSWVRWEDLAQDARGAGGVRVPNREPGVYEARRRDEEERVTIGKASDLRMRVKQGLIRAKVGHPAGDKIRRDEDTAQVVVRWAITDRPAAAEEELRKQHVARWGHLPRYTGHT